MEKQSKAVLCNMCLVYRYVVPTFYHAQTTFREQGLAGLLPQPRGPKGRHKLSSEVLQHILALKTADPALTTAQCVGEIQQRFGISVHRRSLERALQSKKKPRQPLRPS